MSNVIASPADDSTDKAPALVIERRLAVGDAHKRQYGAIKEYAEVLCNYLPEAWYDVEHNSLKEEDKPVLAEAKQFRAALKAAGHSNPSVMWTRVRNAGRVYMEGETEDTASAGAKPQRSLQLRFIEELTKLYKAGKGAESLTSQQQDAMTFINSALLTLGVDTSAIVK